MDLSEKIQGDSGVKQISDLLEDPHCKIQVLKMNKCKLTAESCLTIASVLSLGYSTVKELHLSNNSLLDSGVEHLTAVLKNPHCKLENLVLTECGLQEQSCSAVAEVLVSGSSCLRELNLSINDLQDSGVKQLSEALKHPSCRLKKMGLCKCCISEEGCAALVSALETNPAHLTELDLSGNKLGDSGVKQICSLLKNSHCILQTVKLCDNNITEEGYEALSSALKSNPSSHLTDLDLRGNDPGDSGVKKLTEILEDPKYKLNKLRLLKSPAAEEACDSLTKALGSNPLLLRELDLNKCRLTNISVKQLCALLEDPHYRLQKLILNKTVIGTKKNCADLVSSLIKNPSHLRELNLNTNNVNVKNLCTLLENPNCKLEKVELCDCNITEEGYTALSSALKSNPSSHLTDLDLRGNDPGDSGVKKLTEILEDPNCKLEKLRLLSPAAEKFSACLTEALGSNPLLLREMDLSGKIQGDSRVKQLSDLLEDPHCRPEKLKCTRDNEATWFWAVPDNSYKRLPGSADERREWQPLLVLFSLSEGRV
ncbi:ribonuclease inhibitor-like [Brachyhypopomus gauderio]|uniref:ribonuclease inhibitor-like n=1 Tax=Brachyhypopomus gauderio TaxID=698409 RepID=UPI004042AC2A